MGLNRGRRRSGAPAQSAAMRAKAAHAGTTVALCGLLMTGTSPCVNAETISSASNTTLTGKTVSIRVSGADIYTVINLLQSQTKMEIAIKEGEHPYNRVNVFLDHATPEKALRNIAASAGASVTLNPDGVYVLSPLTANDTAAPTPQTAAYPPSADQETRPRVPIGEIRPRKLLLRNISPDYVLKKLGWTQNLQADDEQEIIRPHIGATITPAGGGVTTLPAYGPYPYPYQQPSVPTGHGGSEPNQANDTEAAHRSVDSNDPNVQENQFGFPGGGGGGFGGGGFQGGGGFPGSTGFPGAGGLQGGRGGQQQVQLPEGVDRLYAIEADNSLLVFSTVDGFNLVKEIVKNLDVAARQVQIKVEFVTAQVQDVDNFGINFSLIPSPSVQASISNATSAQITGTIPAPNTYLQFAYGNVAAQLYSLVSTSRGKIVNAPIITTTNNVTANINFATILYFSTTSTTVVPNGGAVNSTQTNQQVIQSTLNVTPRINGDDTVTLTLAPNIQTPTGQPSNGNPAPFSAQTLFTTRTVPSGQTMVLGGLVSKGDTRSTTRVPILADLPILGPLFRAHSINNNDTELLIFVTPTIIDDNRAANGDTAEPQNSSGVNGVAGAQTSPGGSVNP